MKVDSTAIPGLWAIKCVAGLWHGRGRGRRPGGAYGTHVVVVMMTGGATAQLLILFFFFFFYTGLTSSQQRSCRYRRDTACTQHTHAHTHDLA